MKRIAYVLQHFPGVTDTFIRREIRALQRLGTNVEIISVWKAKELRADRGNTSRWSSETTSEILSDWSKETHFVLPASFIWILLVLLKCVLISPVKFFSTLRLGYSTARPGLG